MTVITAPLPFGETVAIVAVRCDGCGVHFGMERSYYDKRAEDHQNFHCPNGCVRHFVVETEAERLRKQLSRTETCLTQTRESLTHMGTRARSAERSVQAHKGVITRMKRRITAGRCICCSHSFKDLERHMKAKHPNYDPDRAAEAIVLKAEQ